MTIDGEAINEIAQLAVTAASPEILVKDRDGNDSVYAFLRRDGETLQVLDVEKYLPIPYRKKGKVEVFNVDSFVHYVNKHKSDATVMLANGPQVTALLNHHAKKEPGWSDHSCVLTMKTTPRFDMWFKFLGQYQEQEDFANSMETLVADIVAPDAGDVLDLVRELRIHSNADYQKVIRPGDGTVQLVYTDEHTTSSPKGSIDFKDGFPIEVVVQAFEGGEDLQLSGKLRYKLANGRLSFAIVVPNMATLIEAAIEDRIQAIVTGTGESVLRGTWNG